MSKDVFWFEKKKTKTSKVSKFLILFYNQNQKLSNLEKFCFIYLFITLFNVELK